MEKVLPQITVHQLVEIYLEPKQLTSTSVATFDIDRAGVFQLELSIPDGHEVRDVVGHAVACGKPVSINGFHAEGAGKERRLIVNLNRKAIGKVGLKLELARMLDEANLLTPTGEAAELMLPVPRASGQFLQRQSGGVVLHVPESLRVTV